MKKLLCLLWVLCLLPCSVALGESLPLEGEAPSSPVGAVPESLPLEGEAPYPPVESALAPDGMSYDDGTISVRVVQDVAFDTNVYYVYVKITDPSQLRTALAGVPGTAATVNPMQLASHSNAVLAINGDFFNGHHSGYVYRQGVCLRQQPAYTRDLGIIDGKGDLRIITSTSNQEQRAQMESFPDPIIQCFCFGPGLIIDGETAQFKYQNKTSCGYPTKAERMIFCQTGPLEYLFFATDGPKVKQPGLTIPECVSLLEAHGGILQAYNLDGGNSTHIILCGNKLNAVSNKSRTIGDIIYFATLIAP